MQGLIKKTARGTSECIDKSKGVYRIYFSLGKDPETGRYRRSPSRRVHCRSKNPKNWPSEVAKALEAYRAELEGASNRGNGPLGLSDYADRFHANRESTMGSPLAYEREGLDIRHIRELFGNPDLTRLKSDDVRTAYAKARKEGRFSESEIRRIHIKLKQIMGDAVDNDLVGKNPCRGVKLPKQNVEARKALSADEAARLLAVLLEEKPSSFITCTMLLLLCGLRKGEALGLSWEDYDPEARTLRVVKQYTNDRTLRPPKSKMSRRKISVGNELADYLDRWKVIQRSEFDSFAVGQTGETPIVHSIGVVDAANGKRALVTRMDGHNYSRAFRLFAVKNGFGTFEESREVIGSDGVKRTRYTGYSGLKPHELRHTQATLLVGANADIKTIQARLGHASPSTTLSIYSHFIEANDQKAASVLDDLLKS